MRSEIGSSVVAEMLAPKRLRHLFTSRRRLELCGARACNSERPRLIFIVSGMKPLSRRLDVAHDLRRVHTPALPSTREWACLCQHLRLKIRMDLS